MNPLVALYVKELKGIRLVGAVLTVATAAIVLVVLNDAADGGIHLSMALLILPYMCPPVLAGLLMHAISQEWAGNTQHQWLALPVPRSTLLLTKMAAVCTLAVAIYMLNTFALYMIYEQVLDTVQSGSMSPTPAGPMKIEAGELWVFTGALFGSLTLLLLGLGLAAASLKMMLNRFRGLLTVAVFLGGLWLTERLAPSVTGAIQSMESMPLDRSVLTAAFDGYLYLAVMGVAFSVAGLYVFDRYADA